MAASKASNTDVFGFRENLSAQAPGLASRLRGRRWCSARAGGAGGRGGAQRCRRREIRLVNRTRRPRRGARARSGDAGDADYGPSLGASAATVLAGAGLLVNTTSLGMAGEPPLDSRSCAAAALGAGVSISSMCRSKPGCSPPRGGAAIRSSMDSACCCIRAGRASRPGLAPSCGSPQRSAERCSRPWRRAPMIVLGLTGSIGMGKSTAAAMLRSDAACRCSMPMPIVHRLLAPGGRRWPWSRRRFPACARRTAGSIAAGSARGFSAIPRRCTGSKPSCTRWCADRERRFLAPGSGRRREPIAVLDIPLLFESRRCDRRCDCVIVVSAPALLAARSACMRRPGMTAERFAAILNAADARCRKAAARRFRRPTGLEPRGRSLRQLAGDRQTALRQGQLARREPAAAPNLRGEGGMREIVLDTETTGLDPQAGHRIVEIACIELMHHIPTGRDFHCYVNPERDMPADALRRARAERGVSRRASAFCHGGRRVPDVCRRGPLVIHNAEFDLAFLNAELTRLAGRRSLASSFVDTLSLARRRFPGAPASLDALCRRFAIDLVGAREARRGDRLRASRGRLSRAARRPPARASISSPPRQQLRSPAHSGPARPAAAPACALPPEELAAHRAMLAMITAPLWHCRRLRSGCARCGVRRRARKLRRSSSVKSIGLIISGGNPPSRVALATMARANGKISRGVSTRITDGSISLRHVAHRHHGAHNELDQEQRLAVDLGAGLDRQHHLEGFGVQLLSLDIDIDSHLRRGRSAASGFAARAGSRTTNP